MIGSSWRQLRDDAGGPWLASPITIAWMAPSMLLASVLFSVNTSTGTPLLRGLIANVIALSLVAALMLALRVTLFRRRRDRPIALAVIVASGAGLGVIKALTTSVIISWPDPLNVVAPALWGKALSAALIGLLLLPAVAIVLATRERFRLERSVLIAEVVQAETQRAGSISLSNLPGSAVNDEALSLFIEETTRRLGQVSDSKTNASAALHDIVESALRPLSQRIWQEQNARYTDFSIRDLAKIAMQEHRFSVILMAAIFSLCSVTFLIGEAGVGEGLLRIAIVVALILVILGGATRIRTTRPWLGILVFWVALVGLCLGIELISTALLGPLQAGRELAFGLIDFLLFAPAALILGCMRVALASNAAIRAQLVPLLGTAGIDRHSAILSLQYNRDMAQYLHSQVQNRMLASALRIEQSHINGSPLDLEAEMQEISDVVMRARMVGSPQPTSAVTLANELATLSQAWFKTIELEFTVSSDASTWNADIVRSVSRLLDEAITNAVRHGFATEVHISIQGHAVDEIAFVSEDNGTLGSIGGPGLGSALYTSLAGPNWSLTHDSNSHKTRLELLMRV